nr:hypothetical protein [Mucilaginibacter sp. L294]
MKNLILIALLFINISVPAPPKDITGKWKVVNTDVSMINLKLTEKEKPMMLNMMKQMFTNAVFDFRANHQCYLTVKIPNVPPNLAWAYEADTGYLVIKETNEPASKIMAVDVKEKNGQIYFAIRETGLVLKMLKL